MCNKNLHAFIFSLIYLQFGGNSLTVKYAGHIENFEDLNTATPSVLIWRDKWTCVCFSCAEVPLNNPSSPKCLLHSCPSKMSSIASDFCFCLLWDSAASQAPQALGKNRVIPD